MSKFGGVVKLFFGGMLVYLGLSMGLSLFFSSLSRQWILLLYPSWWLLGVFSLGAFFLPLYGGVIGFYFFKKQLNWNFFFYCLLSFIPFFTLSTFFHLLFTPSSQSGELLRLLRLFLGQQGSSVVVFLCFVLEVLVIYYFFQLRPRGLSWGRMQKPEFLANTLAVSGFSEISQNSVVPSWRSDSSVDLGEDHAAVDAPVTQEKEDSDFRYRQLLDERQQMLIDLEHPTEQKEIFLLADQSLHAGQNGAQQSYTSELKDYVKKLVKQDYQVPQKESSEIIHWDHLWQGSVGAVPPASDVLDEGDQVVKDASSYLHQQLERQPSPVPYSPQSFSTAWLPEGEKVLPEEEVSSVHQEAIEQELAQDAEILKNTLQEFRIAAQIVGVQRGPSVTRIAILPAEGVRLSKIVNLADNIALRLAAKDVRIVAPIPGKRAVGIEIPNKTRDLISFTSLVRQEVPLHRSDKALPIVLGKDLEGQSIWMDLATTPHLLIAGATGSGKSVCVNALIASLLHARTPQEVRLLLVDPKMVELGLYNGIGHLLTPVITEPKKTLQALQWALYEMERRYGLLDSYSARDIGSYNAKQKDTPLDKLPYIVIIIDEFADLMVTAGKELEGSVARLAAMSRAVGIHLVLATQRPSIDVITGLIKANFPSRIAFMVPSKFDSRVILDTVGAEKLLGRGDMLYMASSSNELARVQGAFLAEEDVLSLVEKVRAYGEPEYIDGEIFLDEEDFETNLQMGEDPLLGKAVEIVRETKRASTSYLQRRLKIGYNRAARLIDMLEQQGSIGPQKGSKPREVF